MATGKHRKFMREPVGDKPVTVLPGVGPDLGKKLEQKGYERADKLLGQFLLLKRDTEAFCDWLKRTSGAKPLLANRCADALKEYCESYI